MDEDDRTSFLTEPDADVGEDASDVLERRLSEIALTIKDDEPAAASTTAYGTFASRVGIGSALAQLPELEPFDADATTAASATKSLFAAHEESAIDRIVDLEKRVEKKRLKGSAGYSSLSPSIHAAVSAKVAQDVEGTLSEGEPYGGILDYVTKKGRKKMRDKKDRVNKAVHEEKARIIADRLKRREEKEKTMDASMPPSKRIAYENDVPALHAPEALYAGTKGQRRATLQMKAIEDQPRKSNREGSHKLERLMKSLAPQERALFSHIAETARHGPGVGLQAVEHAFKAAVSNRASELNYLGALAMAAAVGKIRASVESASPATFRSAAVLKRATDDFHEQAKTPMDAAKATTFANALDEYGMYVRKAASSASTDHGAQAEVALSLGENLADALLDQAVPPSSSSPAWNASHSSVALAAITGRLFESALRSAVPSEEFVTAKVQSFWATDLSRGSWKAITQKHFV
jgi:hypothetical protein